MKTFDLKGFFLIEVVVSASVITVVLMMLLGSIHTSAEASRRNLERTQASFLLEEGAEAIKSIRDQNFAPIANATNATAYYLVWNGSAWGLSLTPSTIDAFTRTITFSAVARDTNHDIVVSGGTLDAGTKKATVTVTWETPSGPYSDDLQFYILNIR